MTKGIEQSGGQQKCGLTLGFGTISKTLYKHFLGDKKMFIHIRMLCTMEKYVNT